MPGIEPGMTRKKIAGLLKGENRLGKPLAAARMAETAGRLCKDAIDQLPLNEL